MKIVKSELIVVKKVLGFESNGKVIKDETGEKYIRHHLENGQWIDQPIAGEINP